LLGLTKRKVKCRHGLQKRACKQWRLEKGEGRGSGCWFGVCLAVGGMKDGGGWARPMRPTKPRGLYSAGVGPAAEDALEKAEKNKQLSLDFLHRVSELEGDLFAQGSNGRWDAAWVGWNGMVPSGEQRVRTGRGRRGEGLACGASPAQGRWNAWDSPKHGWPKLLS
jgi:hypothetical protein